MSSAYDPKAIKVQMVLREMTPEGLARAAKLSTNTVRKVLHGKDAKVSTLSQIAKALDVSVTALFLAPATTHVVNDESSVPSGPTA